MNRKKYITFFAIFLAGFGFSVLVGGVMVFFNIAPSDAEQVVKRWGIYEDAEARLLIPLLKDGVVVQIAHKPTSERLQSIDVMKEEVGSIFKYKVAGELGTPWALYAGSPIGEGWIWEDLDADGCFDNRLVGKKLYVLIDNQWVRAKKVVGRSAITDKGVFEFDTNKGKWIIAPPENSIRDEK